MWSAMGPLWGFLAGVALMYFLQRWMDDQDGDPPFGF